MGRVLRGDAQIIKQILLQLAASAQNESKCLDEVFLTELSRIKRSNYICDDEKLTDFIVIALVPIYLIYKCITDIVLAFKLSKSFKTYLNIIFE